MFQFFANIFGYVLNFIYEFVNNYGLAMIIFTIIIKLVMLTLSIKQQKKLKKNMKLQEKMKVIQFKYKNDPEKLNKEMMKLYKDENMSPFSGCLSAILQIILLFSMFYMVRSPLTYMKKVDTDTLNSYAEQLQQDGKSVSAAYPEIDIIREYDYLQEKNKDDEKIKELSLNMNFLGLDLSKIPQQNLTDWTVYIIPILYIFSSFISMKLTTAMQNKDKKQDNIIDVTENNGTKENSEEKGLIKKEDEEYDPMAQTNKMMSWMMPLMSVSVSLVAPLGLALYWFVSNILMILERIVLNKLIKDD